MRVMVSSVWLLSLLITLSLASCAAGSSCSLTCSCGQKDCPIGQFGVGNACVEVCPTSMNRSLHGNWNSGRCEKVPDGIDYWMDSTLYEIFIPPNTNKTFKYLFFIITDHFQRRHDNYDYIDDITFHLYPSNSSYFYFGNSNTTHAAFEDYYNLYLPDLINKCSLSSATSDPIPLDDYELQVAVSIEGEELLRRDIIIHVVDLLLPLPSPVTCVQFAHQNLVAVESDGSVNITVQLSGRIHLKMFDVTIIAYADKSSSATAGADFTAGRYTATFTSGATTATASIPIVADDIDEPTEQFSLRLYIDGDGYGRGVQKGMIANATVFIVAENNGIKFSQPIYQVGEDDGPAQPVLVLSNPLSTDITVQVRSNDITATGGADYDSGPYTVTFPAGATSVSFNVPIINDNVTECGENFNLYIDPSSLPRVVTVNHLNNATVTIVDNNIAVGFQMSKINIYENVKAAQPVLVLSNPSSTDITVQVRNNDITATGGVDYDSGPYTVTFPAGATIASFDVPIRNDKRYEGNETFSLTIASLPANVDCGVPNLATVTILDDEVAVSFNSSAYQVDEDDGSVKLELVLTGKSSTDIAIKIKRSRNSNATGGVDYDSGPYTVTFPAGVTSVPFDVTIYNDDTYEGREYFALQIVRKPKKVGIITPDKTIVTIFDDEVTFVMFNKSKYTVDKDDGPAQPVLVLSNPSSTDIAVQVRSNDVTATGSNSGPYTVIFPAGATSVPFDVQIHKSRKRKVRLIITQRSLPHGVNIGNPSKATLIIVK